MRLSALVCSTLVLVTAAASAEVAEAPPPVHFGPGITDDVGFSYPKAIHHVGRHDRTYITYADSAEEYDPMVVYYDHRVRKWSAPVEVGQTNVKGDTHGHPALVIDGDGYLYVFYGSHANQHLLSRSVEPESIDQWTAVELPAQKTTYGNLFAVGNTVYWFHRSDESAPEEHCSYGFHSTADRGATWSKYQMVTAPRLLRGPCTYFYPILNASKPGPDGTPSLHVVWTYYYSSTEVRGKLWQDMFHAQSDDLGKTWRDSEGNDLGPVIPFRQGDVVYRGPVGYPIQIMFDPATQDPGFTFYALPTPGNEFTQQVFAFRKDGVWRVRNFWEGGMTGYPGIVAKGPGHYRCYVYRCQQAPDNGLYELETTDGGFTWQFTRQILRKAPFTVNSIQVVENASPELQIFFSTNRNTVHAWGEAGTLPSPSPAPGQQ